MTNSLRGTLLAAQILIVAALILSGFLPQAAAIDLKPSTQALERLSSEVKSRTLPNGLRVLFYRRNEAPVFAGVVSVRVGGSDESMGKTGISHLLEHMAFKGTEKIGTKNFSRERKLLRELEELAAVTDAGNNFNPRQRKHWEELHAELEKIWEPNALSEYYSRWGADGLNATTDKELTQYFVNLPATAFKHWAWLESERILNPVMRQFYQERDVVMEERRMRYENDPGGKLYELLLGMVFLQHPYRNPVIGYPADIARITATDLIDFQRQYYVPGNIVVALVGDLEEELIWPVMERFFGRIPAGPMPKRPNVVEPPQSGERRATLSTHGSREVILAYRKPQYPHPDDPPLTVMLEMLAGSSVSPLYVELVKKRQIASQLDYDEGPGFAYPNYMMFGASIKQPHMNSEFIEVFDQVIDRFQEEPVDLELMDIAKKALAMRHLGQMGANMPLALQMASAELQYGDWKAIIRWYQEMAGVTASDVQRVGRKYLQDNGRTIAAIEPLNNR